MKKHLGLSYYSPGQFLTFIPHFRILQMQSHVGEWHGEDIKSKRMCHKAERKSFPNASHTSYSPATGENSYANSVMQAPFSSGKCVDTDWVSSWWYCSQALRKLIGKREKSWHCTCSSTDFHCARDTHHTELLSTITK